MGFKKIFLFILSILPLKEPAHAKAVAHGNIQPSDSASSHDSTFLKKKDLLFIPFHQVTSTENAFIRFSKLSNIKDETVLNSEFDKLVSDLISFGLIEVREDYTLISKAPSYGGI